MGIDGGGDNGVSRSRAGQRADDASRGGGLASKLSASSLFSINHVHAQQCRHEARLTCRTVARDYCNNTAVHGFRYFFEENRSAQERTFWVVAVLVCFATSFYLISKIWMKWETSPVIVTFADQPSPIWDVPFPAVTICPATKTKREKFNFTQAHQIMLDGGNAAEEMVRQYRALTIVCMSEFTRDNDKFNNSEVDYLREVAPSLDEVIVKCWWQHKEIPNCSDYFREVITEEGVCFSFNALGAGELFSNDTIQAQADGPSRGLHSSGWSVDSGYADATAAAFYPLRSWFVGPYSGMRVILRSYDRDMDYLCRGCEQGFRVFLHNPAEAPWSMSHQIAVPLNASVLALARPSLMKTSEGLRAYSAARRRCFFPEERTLRHHLWYTQENCILDCFANITLDKCNCTLLGSPRSENARVCSLLSKCVSAIIDTMMNETQSKISFNGPLPASCQCLPSCSSLRYEGYSSTFDFPWMEESQARREKLPAEGVSLSQLNIYFESMQFITRRRSELYGHTDFLANFGGLLGLFTGFSVISLVEVAYYVSLRLWCDIRRRRDERRLEGPRTPRVRGARR